MNRTRILIRLGTAALALAAAPAFAQTEPQESDVAERSEPQTSDAADADIVVTARRRAESLQDVPIAVTAYSGETLEATGSLDITDISDTTPNVTLEPSRGTNSTLTAFIRGVGQQDPVAGFESGVGLYLDDVFINRPQAAVLDIYEVERIEVLRGPQGTLYGRNTIGGAIKYVTRRLDDDPFVRIRGAIGNYEQADLILTLSAPIAPGLKIGASGARLSRDGFGRNLTNGLDNYNRDIYAARGTVEWEPTSRLFFRLTGDLTKDKSNPRNGHRLIPGVVSGTPVLSDVYDTRAGLNTPEQDIEAYGMAFRAEWEVSDDFTLKNILGYRRDRSRTPIDFDALPAADVDVPAIYRNRQFSNEFQAVYEGDRLQGLAGVYYLSARATNIFDVILATTSPVALPGLTASTFGDVDTETWAVFGDLTFDVTDQLAVSVGGRYTNDKRQATVIRRNLLRGPSPELGGSPVNGIFNAATNPTGRQFGALTSNFQGEETFKEFTPRASVTFKPNDDNTIYASYAKGFKGGGFDPRGLSTAAPDLDADGVREPGEIFDYFLFEPEKVNSYEIGYKASLFDRRLRFAIAGFYADYKDVQVPGSVGAVINGVPTFVGVTTNAGKAEFKGIEVEMQATLARDFAGAGDRLNFSGTLGYLDAEYKQFITNVPGTGPVDVADFRRIQNTPKWTLSGTLDYTVPVGEGDLSLSTTVSHRSKTFQFETPSPFLDQPAYELWDASLVYTAPDDRWTIGVHAKNILDKQYITSGYQFLTVNPVTGVPLRTAAGALRPSLGTDGVVTAFYGNPRQVFATFGVKF